MTNLRVQDAALVERAAEDAILEAVP